MKKIYLSIVAAVSLMFVSCTADWLNTLGVFTTDYYSIFYR